MSLNSIMKKVSILVLSITVGGLVNVLLTDFADARPGARGGRGGGGAMRSGPAASGSVRGSHRDNRHDRRENQRDNRRDRADNRQENRQDVRNERQEFREDRWRRHRGRHITRAAFRSLNCRTTVIVDAGISYYSCGGTYYERVYQGGTVVYVVVSAPSGY
jgi:hypothetical protein